MNEDIKKLVFKDVTDLDEALEIPLCKKFYNQLAVKEEDDVAKRETLSLYNESRWLTCQELLCLQMVDLCVLRPSTNSKYYDTNWLLALKGATSGLLLDKNMEKEMPMMMQLLNDNSIIAREDRPSLNDWGYPHFSCPVTYAPISEWGDLSMYDWEEMTVMYNLELLDQLYKKAKTWKERQMLFEVIRSDAKVTWNTHLKEEKVYLWLCKIRVSLMKAPSDEVENKNSKIEKDVLVLKRGEDLLDKGYLKSSLKQLIHRGTIPTTRGYGYIWYAVWLFFKKNNLLRNDSQRAFHRLMDCWFPNCGYGDDDKMRLYNSVYLERYRWQIWKYEEFKRTAKSKTTKRGFEGILNLYEELEGLINTQIIWENEV